MIPRSVEAGKKSGYQEVDLDFLSRLSDDFADFSFRFGKKFAFKPPRTIIIGPHELRWKLLLLHELGHATLHHTTFNTDVTRLKMEAETWEKARKLADIYGVKFDEDLAQAELDTYRDWLHQKSRCPKCGLTRFETPNGQYHCPRCENF